MLVVVLDYGSGNVRSAVRALERVSGELAAGPAASITSAGSAADEASEQREPIEVRLSADRGLAVAADALVVPGVGAFAACMAGLRGVDAGPLLAERVSAGRPILGICVGMQVLFESGIEHGIETAGLGLLPGRVERLRAPIVPHMGWNTVTPPPESTLFAGVAEGTRFYFVHSYAVRFDPGTPPLGYAATVTEHGERFVSAAESPLVSATQFHPEKSGSAGQQLLRNWLTSVPVPA